MRILLVDDEQRLLDSLRRTLRVERPGWQVRVAASGDEAMQVLAANPIDVLVTDMQMPGMDGAAVLRETMRIAPGTVRIVLSGQAGRERILACESSFHQFLGKPLTPDAFIQVLDSLDPARDRPETLRARGLVAGRESLPSLPRLHRELAERLAEGNPSLLTIAGIIRQDLGLASKVLKLVNSPYLAGERKVGNLAQAVELLSLDLLKSAVLVHGAVATAHSLSPSGLDLENLWGHSHTVAASARTLALASGADTAVAEDCYTAGLLHDLGQAVLAGEPRLEYREVLERSRDRKRPLVELERDRYGTDHAEVGAEQLRLWGLDPRLCQAVRGHHQGAPAQDGFSIQLAVQFADCWSSLLPTHAPFADGHPLPDGGGREALFDSWAGILGAAYPDGLLPRAAHVH